MHQTSFRVSLNGGKDILETIRTGNKLVQGEETATYSESLARIQELKGRRDRIQEQLTKANQALLQAKDARDNLLLAMYGIDHQIDLLEEGQIPLFGEDDYE